MGIIKQYFGMMGFFLSYRLMFIFLYLNQIAFGDIPEILLEGVISDAFVLSCAYIPAWLITTLSFFFGSKTNLLNTIRNCYLIIVYVLFLFVICINIL
ncbi:MAG: hypothetical protein ACI4B3_02820, partial [Prevotella sp.]